MLLARIPANSIHSLLSHAYYAFQWQWISFLLEMEPPDAEKVAVASRDHSLVSRLKERVSRRNLISQSAHPGVDILSRVQHRKVARATQALFSSNAQLRSCHKFFSHYRQPPHSFHQSVLISKWFAAANAKALIFLDLVHPTYGPPQLRRSSVAIDTLQYSCVVGADHNIINTHEVSLIM